MYIYIVYVYHSFINHLFSPSPPPPPPLQYLREGRNDGDSPSNWDWPTVRAAKPREIPSLPKKLAVSGSAESALQEPPRGGSAEQNHLAPRGDISDLVNTGGPVGAGKTTEVGVGVERRDVETRVKSKTERLSNGFSEHAPKEALRTDEDESMETTPPSAEPVVNGNSRQQDVEMEGEEEEEGKRSSEGSSEDELRQSVGSVTSSEFNPNVFGGVCEEEMRGVGEEGGAQDSTTAADVTAYQVCMYNVHVYMYMHFP